MEAAAPRGQADYDLAKRTALALFTWRESVRRVRTPFMWEEEMASTATKDVGKDPVRVAYERRWAKHATVATRLDALALEAEALWGGTVRKPFGAVWDVQRRLGFAIQDYLYRRDTAKGGEPIPVEEREKYASEDQALREIVYGSEDDAIWGDVVAAVAGVEEILKPHLGRSRK